MQRRIIKPLAVLAAFVAGGTRAAPRLGEGFELGATVADSSCIATAHSPAGDAFAAFAWVTFEDEPLAGTLAVLRGEGPPLRLTGVWSAAFDADWSRLAVGEEIKVLDNTTNPPFERTKFICCQMGMTAAELRDVLYYDSFAGNGYVTVPVVYELASGAREPQPVAGGDFVDWVDGERLIIGREVGGAKSAAASKLLLVGYNIGTGVATVVADAEGAEEKLAGKLSPGVARPPYLPAAWRLKISPTTAAPAVVEVPARAGRFENTAAGAAPAFYWRDAGGEPVEVGGGVLLDVSADGRWALFLDEGSRSGHLKAGRLTWP